MQIIKRTPTEIEVNILGVFQLLWQKIWIILFSALLLGVLAFIGSSILITPKYTASITLYVNNSASADASTSITTSDLTASAKLVDTYAAIISSDAVLDDVTAQLGTSLTSEQLKGMVSTSAVNNTEVFKVLVVDTDPSRAADVANVIAEVLPAKIGEIVEGSSTKVIDYAKVPSQISSPNYKRFAQIGTMIGLVASALIILMREILDTRIKSEADLGSWDVPILGVVPEFTAAAKQAAYGYGYAQQGSRRKR